MNDLINLLGIGAENASSREYLAMTLGTTDRNVRKLIAQAREGGVPIISSSHVSGYFLPSSEKELIQFKREQLSRIHEIMKGIDGLTDWEVQMCRTGS